ncbi:MAG: hypothetical protein HN610_01370 [Verrucomicrobia bacterium]|nr:hypothetical protein [Verrucomicrobiota bacterium]MBT7534193.1 hypothetical protein [Verrucomicrobiota bacterium]
MKRRLPASNIGHATIEVDEQNHHERLSLKNIDKGLGVTVPVTDPL